MAVSVNNPPDPSQYPGLSVEQINAYIQAFGPEDGHKFLLQAIKRNTFLQQPLIERFKQLPKMLFAPMDEDEYFEQQFRYVTERNNISLILCIVIFVVFILVPHPYYTRTGIIIRFVCLWLGLFVLVSFLNIFVYIKGTSGIWNASMGLFFHQLITKHGYMRLTASKRPKWHAIVIWVLLGILLLNNLQFAIYSHVWVLHATTMGHIIYFCFGYLMGHVMSVKVQKHMK